MHVWVIEYQSPDEQWFPTWDLAQKRSHARRMLAEIKELRPYPPHRVRKYVRV